MADNNLVRDRNEFRDIFADDDPLAELARIVGYEDRPVVSPEAPLGAAVPEPRREPALNLEDELLREFERYDAPRLDPVHDITLDEAPRGAEPTPFVPGSSIEPEDLEFISVNADKDEPPVAYPPSEGETFDRRDLDFGDEVAPPAFDAHVESIEAEPAEAEPVEAESIEAELAAELAQGPGHVDPVVHMPELPVMGDVSAVPQASFSEPDEQSVEEFDLAAELENSIGSAPVVESQPEERGEPKGKGGYVPGFRMPLANFAPASALRQEPIALEPAGQAFDLPVWQDAPASEQKQVFVAEAPVAGDPEISEPAAPEDVRPAAPIVSPAILEPAPAGDRFSALDELIHDVQRYSLPTETSSPAAAVVTTPEPAPSEAVVAPVSVAPASSVAEVPAAGLPVVEEKDPFSDEEFELALDDLELDLADIVMEDAQKLPEKAAHVAAAADKIEAAPTKPAISAASVAPAVAAVAVVEPKVKEEVETVADLPFDPAQISDSEEQVEAIAELDVPSLPAEEPEQPPVYKPDYDLDIDAELATLLMTPEKAEAAPARKPAIDIASAAAKGTADRAAQTARAPNYSDLDDFERALEEDFRRSLAAPLPPANDEEPHFAEADYLSTVEKARSSVRSWAVPVVLAGVVILGGVGAYAWLGNGVPGIGGGGEPVVIAADTEPVKVAPENPGGKTVPNQDKAVYDRVAGVASQDPKQETLISSNEEPVDVVQKTLMPDTLPLEGENDIEPTDVGETEDPRLLPEDQRPEQAVASAEQQPVTVMPRKVKTMIVRPDGKLVEQEVPAPALAAPEPAKVPAAGEKLPEVAAAPAQTPAPATSVQTQPVPSAPNAGTIPVSAPAAASEPFDPVAPDIALPPVETAAAPAAPAEAAPAPAAQVPAEASDPAPAVRAPVPIARPSEQPVNVVAAVTDQGNVRAPNQPAAAAAPAQAQVASVGEGGYLIQIASLPSQAEAQKSYQSLSAKFGSVIGGRGVDIKAADIAGKGTFYRVRIPAGSKNDAVALCERYRAAGGSCLVAR